MTRTDTTREQLTEMVRAAPFHPFALNMENGGKVIIEHPENIAFDSTAIGRERLFVITNKLLLNSSLSAVASVAQLDTTHALDGA